MTFCCGCRKEEVCRSLLTIFYSGLLAFIPLGANSVSFFNYKHRIFFNGRGNINVSPILVFINHAEAFRLGGTRVSEGEVGLEFHLADWEISPKIF